MNPVTISNSCLVCLLFTVNVVATLMVLWLGKDIIPFRKIPFQNGIYSYKQSDIGSHSCYIATMLHVDPHYIASYLYNLHKVS